MTNEAGAAALEIASSKESSIISLPFAGIVAFRGAEDKEEGDSNMRTLKFNSPNIVYASEDALAGRGGYGYVVAQGFDAVARFAGNGSSPARLLSRTSVGGDLEWVFEDESGVYTVMLMAIDNVLDVSWERRDSAEQEMGPMKGGVISEALALTAGLIEPVYITRASGNSAVDGSESVRA